MPTYNRARYLDCLLQDLSANIGDLGFSYELLIGDNASTDSTADVVRKYEDSLEICYHRRPENLGADRNISQLFAAAQGKYLVYLADDDFLIPGILGRCIARMEENPDIGAVFAPWLNHDRVANKDFGKFYALDNEVQINAGDHAGLFRFLINGHIFPEIYVGRTDLVRQIALPANAFAFVYFVQIAAMVDRTAVMFSPDPFYRQVGRYFADESRAQAGHQEVKTGWDRYRGGMEYILSKFASQLSPEEIGQCYLAIDRFTVMRMQVGLRVRTTQGGDWVDTYYIANRLRAAGDDSLLPAPYAAYRINAALEYLLNLQPFYPKLATLAYFNDDPPQIINQATDFTGGPFTVLTDRFIPLSPNTILLTSRAYVPQQSGALVISEADVLARFP